jgi:glycolate oxidase iron-sulfur subunit
VENIIQSARELLAEKVGIPDAAREVFRSILLDPASFRAELLSRPPTSSLPRPPLWQLPLFFHEGSRLPELAAQTVLDKYPEYISSGGQRRIALFVGCSMNYVHTDIADSAIDVLKKFDVDIYLPKKQLCCGAPVLLFGDRDGARELAKRNLAALKADEFDAVITLCPACGVTLEREYERILDGDVGELTSKVYDISAFINFCMEDAPIVSVPIDATVTYHDPCYLRLGQEVEDEPRRILDSSAQFVEMEDADKCCGLGGTLGLFHPELSRKMGEAKIKAIANSQANIVATGCPGCIAFLRDQLAEKGIQKDVLHTVQILQKCLDA